MFCWPKLIGRQDDFCKKSGFDILKKLIMYQNLQEPEPFTIFVVWYSAGIHRKLWIGDLKCPSFLNLVLLYTQSNKQLFCDRRM